MAKQVINNGEDGVDVRTKLNENFTEVYTVTDYLTITGSVDLDQMDIDVAANTDVTEHITVTGSVNLDTINTDVTALKAIGTQVEVTATRDLLLTDKDKLLKSTSATAVVITVPPNSSVAFAIGDELVITQYGAGTVTFSPGAAVTINSLGSNLLITAIYGVAKLTKIGTDEWLLSGDLTT